MWKASSSAWEKISGNVQSILELCFKSSVIDVYSLQSRGSDDVEDLCVDELGFFDLPIIIGLEPRSAKVVYKSLLEDSLATGSLVYFLKRLPSQRILEPLSLTDIIRTFFSNSELSLGTIFLSGDRSSVGKSSISYGILSSLLYYGVPPDRLAYIKPVTQCEAEQLVTRYCREVGIATEAVSPVVFYKGFTRAFLQGNTDNASILISQVVGSVSMIGQGKTLVVVDGVGYPSVGSICNISNAHVAQALSSPVLLVGKSGVGDAIDSHNINSTYFQSFGVTVLGAVFNKFPLEGFYNIDSCRESISSYFEQFKRDQAVYGYLPQVEVDNPESFPAKFNQMFRENFDLGRFLLDIFRYKVHRQEDDSVSNSIADDDDYDYMDTPVQSPVPMKPSKLSLYRPQSSKVSSIPSSPKKRTREEIEGEAVCNGALGG